MQERLRAFILTRQLISQNDQIFAAVSGGKDSMVMLDLLHKLSAEMPFELRVLHVNHGVRGASSDADQALVKDQADRLKLPFEYKILSGLDNSSSEDVMRRARYAAFEEILLQYPGAKTASAHHLDDQLETFLMRLAKGAGLKGLSGIPLKRGRFIRPMLSFRRSEIDAYAAQNSVPFHEDHTNADTSKLRNHIRHKAVPAVMDVFGSSFYEGFSKSLNEIKNHNQLFSEENEQNFTNMLHLKGREGRLDASAYAGLSALRRRAVFQYCISCLNPLTFSASDDLWQAFDRFTVHASTGAQFQAGGGLSVIKNRNGLFFFRPAPGALKPVELYPGRPVFWGRFKISLQEVKAEAVTMNNRRSQEFFCADRVILPLIIRTWQEGDFFYPLGMKGKKKLSDFFVDQKIDLHEKNSVPLICSGDDIIWAAGLRLDDRFKMYGTCKKIYQLNLEGKGSSV